MNRVLRFLACLLPLACAATVQAQALPSAAVSAGAAPSANLSFLEGINPFDGQRATWPDRVPPPPPPQPPPPPPPPVPVTDQDLQLYGVTLVGNQRLATVKVGKRFADSIPQGRAFTTLAQGQAIGEFTIATINPDSVLLQAVGSQQRLTFTSKTDRGAGMNTAMAAPAPVQGASNPGAETATPTPSDAPASTTGGQLGGGTPAAAGNINVQAAGQGQNAAPATAAPFNLRNSLAATLEAMRNNAPRPAPAPGNPAANPFQK